MVVADGEVLAALEQEVAGALVVAADVERRPQLGQRQHAALPRVDARARGRADGLDAAEVRRRVLPAVGPAEVDEPARGERGDEVLAGLLVDQRPAGAADR